MQNNKEVNHHLFLFLNFQDVCFPLTDCFFFSFVGKDDVNVANNAAFATCSLNNTNPTHHHTAPKRSRGIIIIPDNNAYVVLIYTHTLNGTTLHNTHPLTDSSPPLVFFCFWLLSRFFSLTHSVCIIVVHITCGIREEKRDIRYY